MSTQARLVEEIQVYKIKDQEFEGFVAYDTRFKNKLPGVLVVHDWMGITDRTRDEVRSLAKSGHVAFAADIYGKNLRPKDPKEAGSLAGKYKADRKLFREHLNAALEALKNHKAANPSKLTAIGFCFGGTGVLELARSGAPVVGVVSFHGGLDAPNPQDAKNIKGRVLALHGAIDPFVKEEDLKAFELEMQNANVDYQLVKYGGAVHSFTNKSAGSDIKTGSAYNEMTDRRSRLAMEQFFKELF